MKFDLGGIDDVTATHHSHLYKFKIKNVTKFLKINNLDSFKSNSSKLKSNFMNMTFMFVIHYIILLFWN